MTWDIVGQWCDVALWPVISGLAHIGVARILSGGALFFPEKVDDLFSRRPQKIKIQAKTNELTTPTV